MRSDGTDQIKIAAERSDGSEVGAPTWVPRRQANRLHQIGLGLQRTWRFR